MMQMANQQRLSGIEQLAFEADKLNTSMIKAGFFLARYDDTSLKDMAYRADYIRSKTTLFPTLHVKFEYYLATRAYNLKISATSESDEKIFNCLIKNSKDDLDNLLNDYFMSTRRGVKFNPAEKKR